MARLLISLPGHTRGHACVAVDAGHRWVLHPCADPDLMIVSAHDPTLYERARESA